MTNKRRRNKSSPGTLKQDLKKHRINKQVPNSSKNNNSNRRDSTADFSGANQDGSFLSTPPTSPTPPTPSTMAAMETSSNIDLSDSSIENLVSKLAPLLVKTLKHDLIRELKEDISTMVLEQVSPLKTEIEKLKRENEQIKSDLRVYLQNQDELEQYGRRMCLDISGIKDDTGSTGEDVERKILALTRNQGIPLKPDDIDRCHRKGKPREGVNRKVIVKFTNSKARHLVYSNRKNLGGNIYVQENLTKLREELAFESRKLKRENLATKTWVAGCKVWVQLTGQTKSTQIRDLEDIRNVRAGAPIVR